MTKGKIKTAEMLKKLKGGGQFYHSTVLFIPKIYLVLKVDVTFDESPTRYFMDL